MNKQIGEKTITIREPLDKSSKLTTEQDELKEKFKQLAGWEELQDHIGVFYGQELKFQFNYEFTPPEARWEPKKLLSFDELYDISQEKRLSLADYLKSGLPAGEQIIKLCIGSPLKHFIQLPFRLHVIAGRTQHETQTITAAAPAAATLPQKDDTITTRDLLPYLFQSRQNDNQNDNTEIMLEMIRQQREDSANQLAALKEEMAKDREFYSSSAMGLQDVIEQWQTIKEFEQQVTPAPMAPDSKFGQPPAEQKKEESETMQMFKGALEFFKDNRGGKAQPAPGPSVNPLETLHEKRIRIIGMLGAMEPANRVLLALKDMIEFSNTHNLMEYIPELMQHEGNYQAAFSQMLDNYCQDSNYKQQLIDVAQANTNGHREDTNLNRDKVSAEG